MKLKGVAVLAKAITLAYGYAVLRIAEIVLEPLCSLEYEVLQREIAKTQFPKGRQQCRTEIAASRRENDRLAACVGSAVELLQFPERDTGSARSELGPKNRRFERDRKPFARKMKKWWGGRFLKELDRVLEFVRENGAVKARELEEMPRKRKGEWWDWRPSKAAIEYLWRTGPIAIARREGFEKVYDLAERVIPDQVRTVMPSSG